MIVGGGVFVDGLGNTGTRRRQRRSGAAAQRASATKTLAAVGREWLGTRGFTSPVLVRDRLAISSSIERITSGAAARSQV